MYPLPAVLVSCTDPDVPHLRAMLGDNAVHVAAEFPGPAELLARWPCPPDPKPRLLFVRLRSLADVTGLGRIESALPGWPVIALVEGDYDTTALFQVSRAGAAQLLPLGFTHADLDSALDRVLTQFGVRKTPSRVIAVTGVVEGCGATTIAINLANELAQAAGVPTVLAELSAGPGRLAAHLDLNPTETVRDVLAGEGPTLAGVQSALLRENEFLAVLCGPTRTIDPHAPAPQKVQQIIHLLRHLGTFVVLDLAYTYDAGYFEALAAADELIIVGRQDVPAVQAAKLFIEVLAERGLPRPLMVLNAYDAEREEFRASRLQELLGLPAVHPVAEDREGVRRAADSGRPIRAASPNSPAVRDLRAVANLILAEAGLTRRESEAEPPGWARRLYERVVRFAEAHR